ATNLQPLKFSSSMSAAARLHVMQQGILGGIGHRGTDDSQPWDRMARFGKWVGCAGENISYGQRSAREIVCALIVDDGVRGRGHRKNIFNREFAIAGVATGTHARFGSMCVIDFAGGFVENPARL